MQINFNDRLSTYVAQDASGVVQAIYCPDTHGTLGEFRLIVAQQA